MNFSLFSILIVSDECVLGYRDIHTQNISHAHNTYNTGSVEENITEVEEVGVLADVLWLEHIQHSIDGAGDLAFLYDPLEE